VGQRVRGGQDVAQSHVPATAVDDRTGAEHLLAGRALGAPA
jgi:hypothetical protein